MKAIKMGMGGSVHEWNCVGQVGISIDSQMVKTNPIAEAHVG